MPGKPWEPNNSCANPIRKLQLASILEDLCNPFLVIGMVCHGSITLYHSKRFTRMVSGKIDTNTILFPRKYAPDLPTSQNSVKITMPTPWLHIFWMVKTFRKEPPSYVSCFGFPRPTSYHESNIIR